MKNSNNYLADTTTESENKSKNKQTKRTMAMGSRDRCQQVTAKD